MKTIVALITSSLLTISVLVCKAEEYYSKPNVREGLVFQMEINSSHISDKQAFCRNYNPDKIHNRQYVWFQFGDFDSKLHASEFLTEFKQLYPKTHMIAFLNKTKIPMEYADMLDNLVSLCQQQQNRYNSSLSISTSEVNNMIQLKNSTREYQYSVVMPAANVKAIDAILNTKVKTQVIKLNESQAVFVIGNYASPQEAIALRNHLIEKGFSQVHLIASLDTK